MCKSQFQLTSIVVVQERSILLLNFCQFFINKHFWYDILRNVCENSKNIRNKTTLRFGLASECFAREKRVACCSLDESSLHLIALLMYLMFYDQTSCSVDDKNLSIICDKIRAWQNCVLPLYHILPLKYVSTWRHSVMCKKINIFLCDANFNRHRYCTFLSSLWVNNCKNNLVFHTCFHESGK